MFQVKIHIQEIIPISRTSSHNIILFSGLARFHQKITVNFTRHNAFFHGQKIGFVSATPEMEFLDISSTKDSSLLLHAIHSPLYWRILKKTILFSGFKNYTKKSAKQENSSLFMNSILQSGKMRLENQKKTRV